MNILKKILIIAGFASVTSGVLAGDFIFKPDGIYDLSKIEPNLIAITGQVISGYAKVGDEIKITKSDGSVISAKLANVQVLVDGEPKNYEDARLNEWLGLHFYGLNKDAIDVTKSLTK